MTFVIIEGVDRCGKSTVAEQYRAKGFDVIHFSAPDIKYSKPGYTGPSYLEDVLDIMIKLSGKDVVFDRTPNYGELIWPNIYNRTPAMSEEDIDIIREIEDQNQPERILMWDDDIKAHWRRCVDNGEPLDYDQYLLARKLYKGMADKYGFSVRTLKDFVITAPVETIPTPDPVVVLQVKEEPEEPIKTSAVSMSPEQKRLAEANAINDVLSKSIVKLKGEHYASIEAKIRSFLNEELAILLGSPKALVENPLSIDEIAIFRSLIKRSSK